MAFRRQNRRRSDWPEPSAEYLNNLADSVRQTRRQARRDARRGGFSLGLAPAAIFALVLALAGIVGASTATGAGGGVVRAVTSIVVNTSSTHDDGQGNSAQAGKHDDEGDGDNNDNDDGDNNDNDDDNGQYDQYDHQCTNSDQERRALDQQQRDERRRLLQAQTAPHPGLSGNALRITLAQERRALGEHQQAALRVLSAKQDHCNGDHGHGGHGHGGNGD